MSKRKALDDPPEGFEVPHARTDGTLDDNADRKAALARKAARRQEQRHEQRTSEKAELDARMAHAQAEQRDLAAQDCAANNMCRYFAHKLAHALLALKHW